MIADAPGLGRSTHGLRVRGWRATLYPAGIAHSIVGGSAWEPTPWRAAQRAARPFRARGYPVTPALYVVAIFAC